MPYKKIFTMFRNISPAVKNLLVINILVFMAQTMLPWGRTIDTTFALHTFGSDDFKAFQIITSMFMHADFSHLFMNMFALWMFGPLLERDLGTNKFLVYYFVCGIGGGILHDLTLMWQTHSMLEQAQQFFDNPSNSLLAQFIADYGRGVYAFPTLEGALDSYPLINGAHDAVNDIIESYSNRTTVGASGAIFGILLAFGMLHPNDRIMLLIPPIPMRAKYFVIAYAVAELALGLYGNDNIAHFAHLGGMLFGLILILYWRRHGGLYNYMRWD